MKLRILLLLTALVLSSIACSGLSATPTSTATELPTKEAGSPTPLPPTATSQPTEATDGSGIELVGPLEFMAQARAAVDLLANCDSEALAEVDQQLDSIVHSDRSGMDTGRGAFMASDVTAFAPGYPPEAQVFWFAGAMVHDAHHRVQAEQGMTNNWDKMTLAER